MPFALLLFYRVLGILLWVLVLLMLWEKYRIVRGGTLLPANPEYPPRPLDSRVRILGRALRTAVPPRRPHQSPRGCGRILLPGSIYRKRPADGAPY